MKIYGQTDEIIVREMVEDDCKKFLELMNEHGTNEDFTVEDICVLWEFRNKKGDIQCTITSIDGATVYGFCGILYSHNDKTVHADVLAAYKDKGYEEQAKQLL